MITSANMGLVIWDLEADDYDHVQLADNWAAVDGHDHTSGKGLQVPAGGIADNAITSAKLADDSVTGPKIVDNTIVRANLAFDEGTLGDVKWWWRPNQNVQPDLQGGLWAIADGRTLQPSEHQWPGGGQVTLPNLVNAFPLGARLTNTGLTPADPPAIGQAGGAHTLNLRHTHTVDGDAVVPDSHQDGFGNILIRNWGYPFWPWGGNWWGIDVALLSDAALSQTTDIRPKHVGLLPLMRVKLR